MMFDKATAWLKDGTKDLKLKPREARLLSHFLERPGEIATKDELLKVISQDAFVSESGLTTSIGVLRQNLGDQARAPLFIETVTGRGYRFIGSVSRVSTRRWRIGHSPVFPDWQVGRDEALVQMHRWYTQVIQGRRQVGIITGEAGIGKTTVLNIFIEQIANQGGIVILRGRCVEHFSVGETYLPIFEALCQGCKGPQGSRLRDLLHQYAPSWLLHMPGMLSSSEYEACYRLHGETRQPRMMHELAEALAAFAAETPLVFVVEDLHVSDMSTLGLLSLLIQRQVLDQSLFLFTFRPEEVAARGHPLGAAWPLWQRQDHVEELPLTLLAEEHITTYLATLYPGHNCLIPLAQALHQRTSGNPLFLVLMLDYLITQGVMYRQEETWTLCEDWETQLKTIPRKLKDVVIQRLAFCSPEEKEVLEVASVVGVIFSAASVAAGVNCNILANNNIITTEFWCEQLVRRALFLSRHGTESWPNGTKATQYVFCHIVYQQVLYEQVPAARRTALHRYVGQCLEEVYRDRPQDAAMPLTYHFKESNDYDKAIEYNYAAVENALQRGGYQEAVALVQIGLDLLPNFTEISLRRQHELRFYSKLGIAFQMLKGYAASEVRQAYEQVNILCQQVNTFQHFEAVAGLYAFYAVRAEAEAAQAWSERCLRLAEHQHSADVLARAYVAHGMSQFFFPGRFVTANTSFEKSITFIRHDLQHHDLPFGQIWS